jgi:hypothetical protein
LSTSRNLRGSSLPITDMTDMTGLLARSGVPTTPRGIALPLAREKDHLPAAEQSVAARPSARLVGRGSERCLPICLPVAIAAHPYAEPRQPGPTMERRVPMLLTLPYH